MGVGSGVAVGAAVSVGVGGGVSVAVAEGAGVFVAGGKLVSVGAAAAVGRHDTSIRLNRKNNANISKDFGLVSILQSPINTETCPNLSWQVLESGYYLTHSQISV
jgi:hypothetical protein